MNGALVSLALLAAAAGGWRYYRRRPAAGRWLLLAVAAAAVAVSVARMRAILRPETPIVPRGVHAAAGVRLGELAAGAIADGAAVLVVRPRAEHPARAEIGRAQIEGIREALRRRRARLVVEEFDLFADEFAQLSVPSLPPETVRAWVERHGAAGTAVGAVVSLCGAPKIDGASRVDGLPPLFALSFTETERLRGAFASGWLQAAVRQTATGRDLDLRRMSAREIFDATFELATVEEARAGRILFLP